MKGEYTGQDGHRYGWLPTAHPGVAHCALDGEMKGCAVAIKNEDIPAALSALAEMVEREEPTSNALAEAVRTVPVISGGFRYKTDYEDTDGVVMRYSDYSRLCSLAREGQA